MRRFLLCLLCWVTMAAEAKDAIKVFGDAVFVQPQSLAFTADGDAYGVESAVANRVFKLHASHAEYISGVRWDSGPKGQKPPAPHHPLDLAPAVYSGMADIAVGPDGSIYVADSLQHRIVRIDPQTHAATPFAGTGRAGFAGDGGPADRARFDIPTGISVDPSGKSLIVADLGNHRVRRIDLSTQIVTTIAGNGQEGLPKDGANALSSPLDYVRSAGIAPDGTLYALLVRHHALVAIKDGKTTIVVNKSGEAGPATDGPAAAARMNRPRAMTLDAKGRVLILDTENHCVRLFDPTLQTIRTIAGNGEAGTTLGTDWAGTRLNRPHGARLGPDGRLYVADSENNRILVGPAP